MGDESIIQNEYKIWRKNVPLLYDLVYTQTLKYPTPCIQWFPDVQRVDNVKSVQRILSTTYSNGESKEQLLISQINFPDMVDEDSLNNADIDYKICQSIPLPVDVNKCRYCPLATNIIACRTSKSEILIYDYTKHSSFNSAKGPDAILKGHTDGGFAINWSPIKFGQLISGGGDKQVNFYDINSGLVFSKSYHTKVVNDVAFSNFDCNVFSSVSDDLKLAINDVRNKDVTVVLEKAHTSSIECCSFSPFKSELIATGSSDASIKVWDIRSLEVPLYTLRGHKDSVINVKWSPHYESLLASGSGDRRVMIWDINKSSVSANQESPVLLFIHGGHSQLVDDIDWNPAEPMEIASVSCDNMIQVWKVPLEKYI